MKNINANLANKLFAYVKHGVDVNEDIKRIYEKSLIVIGDQNQLYIPAFDTYIGISKEEFDNIAYNGVWVRGEGSYSAQTKDTNSLAKGTYSIAEGYNNTSIGRASHTEGRLNKVESNYSHAEGLNNFIRIDAESSHAEGANNNVLGINSHAEGAFTTSDGYSHSEGYGTYAYNTSHAEGKLAYAYTYSHAEGQNTYAINNSHAEGILSYAYEYSHSEGYNNLAYTYSHTEGMFTYAYDHSHAEGNGSNAYIASHSEGMQSSSYRYSHAEGNHTYAYDHSHTEGDSTNAYNISHAEGWVTYANAYSHAEGIASYAYTYSHTEGEYAYAYTYAHAEGRYTYAVNTSHAEGNLSYAFNTSHAEGYLTKADVHSHAEGNASYAFNGSHAEGQFTYANEISHAEGSYTYAYNNSHAEGTYTYATGINSHSEGNTTYAIGSNTHAEGINTYSVGVNSHTEGDSTYANGTSSHAEGAKTITGGTYTKNTLTEAFYSEGNPQGLYAHAEGNATIAKGDNSHTEGLRTFAKGAESHAEGKLTYTNGIASHAEGIATYAVGDASHAEGRYTYAKGLDSHTEGNLSYAIGDASHAEGKLTYAIGSYSHAEGIQTTAYAQDSHAEGNNTYTRGRASHAEGAETITYNLGEHAQGVFNISSKLSDDFGSSGNTHHSIGIGTNTARKNAFEMMQDGTSFLINLGNYTNSELVYYDGTNQSSALSVQEIVNSHLYDGVAIDQNTYKGDANFSYAIIGITTYNGSDLKHHISYVTYGFPTKQYVDNLIEANDAMRYCGTVAPASEANGSFVLTHNPVAGGITDVAHHNIPDTSRGAVYKVSQSGYIGTEYVLAGDMIISYTDNASATTASGWDVINENINLQTLEPVNSENSNGTKRVITNVHLNASGDLSYTYHDLGVYTNTPTYLGFLQTVSGTQTYLIRNDVNGKVHNILRKEQIDLGNTNTFANFGLPVLTNVYLTQDGTTTYLSYSYTYIYAEQAHHSREQYGHDSQANSGVVQLSQNKTYVLTDVNISNNGQLSYTYTGLVVNDSYHADWTTQANLAFGLNRIDGSYGDTTGVITRLYLNANSYVSYAYTNLSGSDTVDTGSIQVKDFVTGYTQSDIGKVAVSWGKFDNAHTTAHEYVSNVVGVNAYEFITNVNLDHTGKLSYVVKQFDFTDSYTYNQELSATIVTASNKPKILINTFTYTNVLADNSYRTYSYNIGKDYGYTYLAKTSTADVSYTYTNLKTIFGKNIAAYGQVYFDESAKFHSPVQMDDELTVDGSVTFKDELTVKRDVTLGTAYRDSILIKGTTTLNNDLYTYKVSYLGYGSLANTYFDTYIGKNINVGNDAYIGNNLTVENKTVLKDTLNVQDAVDFDSTLNVDGNTTLKGTLSVDKATTLKSTLNAQGAVDFDSTLNVDGNTTLKGTLGVDKATTLKSTLNAQGAVDFDSTLNVDGATTLKSTLGVTGNTTIGGTLGVTGATTLSNTLGVSGATTLSSTLGVTGATTLGTANGGNYKLINNEKSEFKDDILIANTYSIFFKNAAGTGSIKALTTNSSNNLLIGSGFVSDYNTQVYGKNIIFYASGDTDTYGIKYTYSSVSEFIPLSNENVYLGSNSNKWRSIYTKDINISGNTEISGVFRAYGVSYLGYNGLGASTGDTYLGKDLYVNNDAYIGNNTTVGGTLNVTSTTTLGNTLTVSSGGAAITGATTITGNTGITGTLTSSNKLTVSGGGAAITGATTITGNTGITGTLTSSDKLTVSSGGADITGITYLKGGTTYIGVAGQNDIFLQRSGSGSNYIHAPQGLAITYGDSNKILLNISSNKNVAVTNSLTVGTGLTISSGGANITGNTGITGTLTSSDKLTVSSGGAAITGATTITGNTGITGTLTSSDKLTVSGGGADITGATTITGDLSITGNTTLGDANTDSITINSGTVTLNNNLKFASLSNLWGTIS